MIRDVRRSGRRFPERGCTLEHEIFRFAKMILRDRCSTSYDLAALFCGRRSTLDRKIARLIGTRPSALRSTFHFWGSRGIASCLMLSTSKNEDRRIISFLTLDRQLQLQLHYTTTLLLQVQIRIYFATLHYTTLILLHYTTLHDTTLITLHYATLHYTTLHYTTLHYANHI